jgi:hypothetical protein
VIIIGGLTLVQKKLVSGEKKVVLVCTLQLFGNTTQFD